MGSFERADQPAEDLAAVSDPPAWSRCLSIAYPARPAGKSCACGWGSVPAGNQPAWRRRPSADRSTDVRCRVMAEPLKAPRRTTVVRLFAVSMNRCAFPGCRTPLISTTGVVVGQVAHIKAQNIGGPRYDAHQTPEQRHGFDNLILLCAVHHIEIDASGNLDMYTVDRLSAIKQAHEEEAAASDQPVMDLSDAAINGLIIQGILNEPSVHMDFRHAMFKVGGEGGQPLGGGGSGGVLTIVGVASLPPESRGRSGREAGPGPWRWRRGKRRAEIRGKTDHGRGRGRWCACVQLLHRQLPPAVATVCSMCSTEGALGIQNRRRNSRCGFRW